MQFVALLCMAGMVFATPFNQTHGTRIAGGELVTAGEVRFMAAVEGPLVLPFECGAVIINPNIVLTGSDCGYVGLVTLLNGKVRVGSLKRNQGGKTITIAQKTVVGGVAILKLARNISIGFQTDTIQLYSGTSIPDYVNVAGWGETSEDVNGLLSQNLRKVIGVRVRADSDCEQKYPDYDSATMFCAGYGHGGCAGDYGGPVYITDGGVDKLVGIVAQRNQCDTQNLPGKYYKISALLAQIQANVQPS